MQEDLEKDVLAQFMNKQGPKKFNRKEFNKLPEEEKEKLRNFNISFINQKRILFSV